MFTVLYTEIRKSLSLAFPMMIGLLAQMSLFLVDALMIGRVGVIPLAGAGFVNNLLANFLVAGFGLCSAVHVFVSRAYGAGNREEMVKVAQAGLAIVLGYGLFWGAFVHLKVDMLYSFGQPVEVIDEARIYAVLYGWNFLPVLAYQVMRNFCEAQNHPWVPTLIQFAGILLNVFLNWIFIFGNLGAPAMGLTGAGLATLLARILMLALLAGFLIKSPRLGAGWRLIAFSMLRWRIFRNFLGVGIPSMIQILFEHGMFTMITIFMGWLGAEYLAAHDIAIKLAAYTFMVPLGLSFATSIRLGQAAGARDLAAIRRIGYCSFAFIAGFMVVCATIITLLHNVFPTFFFDEENSRTLLVMSLASQFLIIAAFFQIFDGIQVVAIGALRGLTDVKIPTLITFVGYWVISTPLAYYLAFPLGLGGAGLWLGLLTGLGLCAIFLSLRFFMIVQSEEKALKGLPGS